MDNKKSIMLFSKETYFIKSIYVLNPNPAKNYTLNIKINQQKYLEQLRKNTTTINLLRLKKISGEHGEKLISY